MSGNDTCKENRTQFCCRGRTRTRCFADIVCDKPDLAEPKVGVQTDVRLAVACFSGTASVISVGLAAALCEPTVCSGQAAGNLTFVHYLPRQLCTVGVNGSF